MSTPGDPPPLPDDKKAFRWHRLVQHSDEPLFVLNARRQLLYVNPAWQAWSGLAAAAVRRQVCRPPRAGIVDERAQPFLAFMAPPPEVMMGRPAQVRRRCPGSPAWCHVHFFPWMKEGRVQAILGRIQQPPLGPAPSAEQAPLPEKVMQLRDQVRRRHTLDLLESDTPAVRRLAAQARLAARTDTPVLILGPTGAGKNWLIRAIHLASPRADQFVASVDAALIPGSLLDELFFVRAERLRLGAVLLEHAGALTPEFQTRLLDRLEEHTLAPRLFVSAFSLDELTGLSPNLVALLSTMTIEVPPLAGRLADWERLMPFLLDRAADAAGTTIRTLSTDAQAFLRLHDWPGNIRELHAVLRDASLRALSDTIAATDLPAYLRQQTPFPVKALNLDELLTTVERRLLELALRQCGGNKSKAAEFLSIWRPRLVRRLEQFGMSAPEPPAESTPGADDA